MDFKEEIILNNFSEKERKYGIASTVQRWKKRKKGKEK